MTGADEPVLRVVRGEPTAEELAALVAVVSARAAAPADRGDATPRSAWVDRASLVRQVPSPGPGAWRRSGWPR